MLGPHGRRGGRQRRARVPQAQGAQRPDDARAHGPIAIVLFAGPDAPSRSSRASTTPRIPATSSGFDCESTPSRASWPRSPPRRSGWARSPSTSSRRRPRRPAPRGEHGVQRVPAARLGARARRLRAEGAQHPRRPPRVLQRHDHPGRRRDGRPRGLSGEPDDTDPALHHRRLRVVLARPDRHGPALGPDAARDDPRRGQARSARRRRAACALKGLVINSSVRA